MEISPIPGDRDFIAVKAPAADLQVSAVVDIAAVARPDRSARSGTRKKTAGAEQTEAEDPATGGESPDSSEDLPPSHISFFA